MNKNEAPKWAEGNYTLFVEGKTVTLTDLKTKKVYTTRCHPEDWFSIEVATFNLFQSLYTDKKEIHVGDIVKVISDGYAYPSYAEWVNKNVEGDDKCRYCYGRYPESGLVGKVLAVAKHGHGCQTRKLAYIRECGGLSCYLVELKGLERVDEND